MITTEEILHLSDLARIEMNRDEAAEMAKEVDSILQYVGQIQNISGGEERLIPEHRNIMRDDVQTNMPGEYTEAILNNAPSREGNYLKVKKIL